MEQLRKGLTSELPLCRTKRDVNRVFEAAEKDIRNRKLSATQCRQVFSDIDKTLSMLLPKEKQTVLIEEVRTRIRLLIAKLS